MAATAAPHTRPWGKRLRAPGGSSVHSESARFGASDTRIATAHLPVGKAMAGDSCNQESALQCPGYSPSLPFQ
jgi:hypothetical protein